MSACTRLGRSSAYVWRIWPPLPTLWAPSRTIINAELSGLCRCWGVVHTTMSHRGEADKLSEPCVDSLPFECLKEAAVTPPAIASPAIQPDAQAVSSLDIHTA